LCDGGPVIDLVQSLLARNRRMAEEHIAHIIKEVVKLSTEIKSLLLDVGKIAPSDRHTEINIYGRFLKKSTSENVEPMIEEDLAALPSVTESGILALLEKRISARTYRFHKKYCLKSRSENAPHIYSIGDTAYQNALHHCIPQQIVLSGESGSGKTINYLHLIDHLFHLGLNPSINSERIKNAIKLIHSLIHASTPANDYSTRSVFRTTVSYGKTGKLSGANFKLQCLEKWRVSSTDIYAWIKGRAKGTGASGPAPGPPFAKRKIGVGAYFVMSVVAAILNLGEIRFHENENNYAEVDSKKPIEHFSDLLDVDNKKMYWVLTNYCHVRNGRAMKKRNTCEEARDLRDALANNLYTKLVDYIVGVINNKLSFGKAIFLNEELQYHFTQRVFAWEYADLENEEVKYTPIPYYSNKDTLNELLGKPEGVLSIIDDASKKGNSGKYVIVRDIKNHGRRCSEMSEGEAAEIIQKEGFKPIAGDSHWSLQAEQTSVPNWDRATPYQLQVQMGPRNISPFSGTVCSTWTSEKSRNNVLDAVKLQRNEVGSLSSYEKNDVWDTPYRWRDSSSTEVARTVCVTKDPVDIDYIRDPNEPIRSVASPLEGLDDYNCKNEDEIYQKQGQSTTKISIENKFQNGTITIGGNTNSRKARYSSNETKIEPHIGGHQFKQGSDRENYTVSTTPANKDFDYIKAKPAPVKHKSNGDPIMELRNIAIKNTANEDDPPFNFQGMLRKTNYRRDSLRRTTDSPNNDDERRDSLKSMINEARRSSLKNALVAVRRFSLTNERELPEAVSSNGQNLKERDVLSRPVSMEISPGLFIDGMEVEL
ncbi:hypothetical protein NQ317_012039, partial [Molorchus minor]